MIKFTLCCDSTVGRQRQKQQNQLGAMIGIQTRVNGSMEPECCSRSSKKITGQDICWFILKVALIISVHGVVAYKRV